MNKVKKIWNDLSESGKRAVIAGGAFSAGVIITSIAML